MSDIVSEKAGSIVTAYLVLTHTQRSRTVIRTNQGICVGRETTLEIGAYRHYENQEHILF